MKPGTAPRCVPSLRHVGGEEPPGAQGCRRLRICTCALPARQPVSRHTTRAPAPAQERGLSPEPAALGNDASPERELQLTAGQ